MSASRLDHRSRPPPPPRQPRPPSQAITGAAGQEVSFSLALTQDQKDIRDWVHGFAADVMRPAAHEWDEKEQTPWPIIQEAAKIGLYGFEGIAQFFADPTGLGLPIVNEELFWGDAGIGMSIMGTSLAVAAIFGQGTGEQIGAVDPALLRHASTTSRSRPSALQSRTRARTSQACARAPSSTRPRTSGCINGQKAWATNGGIADVHVVIASVDRELGSRGHAAFVVPMSRSQGHLPGREGLKARPPGLAHRRRVPRRLPHPRGLRARAARRSSTSAWRGSREGKKAKSQAAMQTFEASRPTVGAQALGIARAAYEYALDYAKEREQFGRKIIENQAIAFTLARMKLEIDAARLLVWRASWMGRNQVPFQNAEGSMSKLKAGEVAVWVTERAIQILGGNGYTREFPVERWHRDAKIYDIFEGTAEIQQLVIARAISGMHIK